MPETVSSVFRDIKTALAGLGHASVEHLRGGASDVSLELVPLPIPAEIAELYRLHDGTDGADLTLGQQWIFPLCVFLPIESALGIYKTLTTETDWPRELFPIFIDGGGGYHAWTASNAATTPITLVDEGRFDLVHLSLLDMLRTNREAFRLNLVTVDDDGALHVEAMTSYFMLGGHMNPTLEYWTRQ